MEILDCTLRDGSYAVEFQFTAEDTALIASALESAGIRLIEVGHGLGLGAARARSAGDDAHGKQAASDEAYLRAAGSVLKAAGFGAFFIPGIGAEDDLRQGATLGMTFVRVGTNVTELAAAEPYVKLAKRLGLTVFSNLMKSYAVSAREFGESARIAEGFGADFVVLVDSAGGMLPEDVRAYLEAARECCGARLGFHGHDNLCMAVANSLQALESGATVLDASLQGLGRSEGNAPTEVLAAVLERRGLAAGLDVNGLLDVSEAFVRPLMRGGGRSGIGITAGRARFHSSFLGRALAAAARFGVDPRDLILRLGERSAVDAPEALVEEVAAELAARGPRSRVRVDFAATTAEAPADFEGRVRARASELRQQAGKLGLPSVLNVVVSPYELTSVSPYVETAYGCAMSNVTLAGPALLDTVLGLVDGLVDYVLLDPGGAMHAWPKTSTVLMYSDHEMWAGATVTQVTFLLGGSVRGKRLAVTGAERLAARAALALAEAGADVRLDRALAMEPFRQAGLHVTVQPFKDAVADADAVISLSPRRPAVSADLVRAMKPGALLYDGGIGSLDREAVPAAEECGIRVVRVDMRPSLGAAALERMGMKRIVEVHMGREVWNGVSVVAGGLIGRQGEVIVDSIRRPTRVIGIADGKGGILQPDVKDESARRVREAIAEKRLAGDGGEHA